VLEEESNQHSHFIAILEDKVTQLSTDFGRLVGEVSALRSAAAGIRTLSEDFSPLKTEIAQKLNDPVVEQLSTELNELRKEVLTQKAQIAVLPVNIEELQNTVTQLSTDFGRLVGEVSALRSASAEIQTLSGETSALKAEIAQKLKDPVVEQLSTEFNEVRNEVSALKTRIAAIPGVFDSRIISAIPEIFAEFRKNHFSLLWRGSRDGFGASEFHRRCDGHANTLTVILDTKGNIFGGFTPVKWDSRAAKSWNDSFNCCKADDSLKTFFSR
jgi:archaellum component FlaC